MKTHRPVFGIIAALLAVIMPVEQAHCAWMSYERSAATAGAHAGSDHSCCAKSTSQPLRTATPASCLCERIPPGALTTHDSGSRPHAAIVVAVVPEAQARFTLGLTRAPAPALDVGSPSLPDDPGAHGLRAPPLSV